MEAIIEQLKKNIHDVIIADGQSEEYFNSFWLIWWDMMGTDCKNGLIKTLQELKDKEI